MTSNIYYNIDDNTITIPVFEGDQPTLENTEFEIRNFKDSEKNNIIFVSHKNIGTAHKLDDGKVVPYPMSDKVIMESDLVIDYETFKQIFPLLKSYYKTGDFGVRDINGYSYTSLCQTSNTYLYYDKDNGTILSCIATSEDEAYDMLYDNFGDRIKRENISRINKINDGWGDISILKGGEELC